MEMQVALANQANHSKETIAQKQYDAQMNMTAAKLNMSLQELEAMLAGKQMDHQSKERIFASEVAIEQRNAQEARARARCRRARVAISARAAPRREGSMIDAYTDTWREVAARANEIIEAISHSAGTVRPELRRKPVPARPHSGDARDTGDGQASGRDDLCQNGSTETPRSQRDLKLESKGWKP